jgi:hypothetical protein
VYGEVGNELRRKVLIMEDTVPEKNAVERDLEGGTCNETI